MYYKNDSEKIICEAINDCKNKTIEQMEQLIKIDNNENSLYNSIIIEMIIDRQQDLDYADRTGSLYI